MSTMISIFNKFNFLHEKASCNRRYEHIFDGSRRVPRSSRYPMCSSYGKHFSPHIPAKFLHIAPLVPTVLTLSSDYLLSAASDDLNLVAAFYGSRRALFLGDICAFPFSVRKTQRCYRSYPRMDCAWSDHDQAEVYIFAATMVQVARGMSSGYLQPISSLEL